MPRNFKLNIVNIIQDGNHHNIICVILGYKSSEKEGKSWDLEKSRITDKSSKWFIRPIKKEILANQNLKTIFLLVLKMYTFDVSLHPVLFSIICYIILNYSKFIF